MNAHHERRSNEEERDMIERVAEAAAEKAIQKFSDLTPWDMSTKEGRDQFRETVSHADLLRKGCVAIKAEGASTALRGLLWIGALALVFGFLYMLGIDPSKLRVINGK